MLHTFLSFSHTEQDTTLIKCESGYVKTNKLYFLNTHTLEWVFMQAKSNQNQSQTKQRHRCRRADAIWYDTKKIQRLFYLFFFGAVFGGLFFSGQPSTAASILWPFDFGHFFCWCWLGSFRPFSRFSCQCVHIIVNIAQHSKFVICEIDFKKTKYSFLIDWHSIEWLTYPGWTHHPLPLLLGYPTFTKAMRICSLIW